MPMTQAPVSGGKPPLVYGPSTLVDPGQSPYAEAVADQIGMTSTHGRRMTVMLIKALEKMGLISALGNGFLIGSDFQAAGNVKSLKLGGSAATIVVIGGSPTINAFGADLTGSNGFTYQTPNASAAATARTQIVMFKDSNYTTGHVSHILSNYAGGANKGPAIYSGGSSLTGSFASTANKIFGYGSTDGSAISELVTASAAHDGWPVCAALRFGDGLMSLHVQGLDVVRQSLASVWQNYATCGIGLSGGGTSGVVGTVYAALDFNASLTSSQIAAVWRVLQHIYSRYATPRRRMLVVGNSLMASSSDGGSNVFSKLLAKPEWSANHSAVNSLNLALAGSRVSGHNEEIAYERGLELAPISTERSIAIVRAGINDITAGKSAAEVIMSTDRLCSALLSYGFEVWLCNHSVVASAGQGLAYGYTPAQQQVRSDVNTWIAAQSAYKPIDLLRIGGTYPSYLDPTSSAFQAGDGLHPSNTARGWEADYITAQIAP